MTSRSDESLGDFHPASTARGYLETLLKAARWRIVLNLALLVLVSLTEGVGLLLLVPLLAVVGVSVQEGTVGHLATWVSSAFAWVGIYPTLPAILGSYVIIVGARSLLQRRQTIASTVLVQEFILHLRHRLYRAIVSSQWLFFTRKRSSDFIHALTREAERAGEGTSQLLNLAANLLVGSVYLLLALKVSVWMTLCALASGVVLMLLLRSGVQQARSSGEQLSGAGEALFAAAAEHLGGMKMAKSYGAEEQNFQMFSRLSGRVTRAWINTQRSYTNTRAGFEIGSVLVLSAILYIALEVLAIPAAGILLLLFLFARLVPRFSSLQHSYQYFVNALPAFARIRTFIQECEAAAEPAAVYNGEAVTLTSGVQLQGVEFSYQGRGSPTLARLDLFMAARQTTAIVGPSGSGKTTIADLVMGLLVPDRGCVLIDKAPLSGEWMRAWRASIGYVPQDAFLFHDTIRANLLWAQPAASEMEIWESLRLAAAEGFVSRLTEGLDTIVGDRGVRLSGGERQRLALARALLRKPSLLILDEATSALDSENEGRIQQAIDELHGDITILIITHRLSSIRGADVIHVLESGRVVESGSWDALTRERGGRFHALWREQAVHLTHQAAERNEVVIS